MSGSKRQAARRSRRRGPLFLGVSLGVHLVLALLAAGVSLEIWVPKPEVTWLDLDNKLGAPRAQKPRPPAPEQVKPASEPPPARRTVKRSLVKARRPRPDAGPGPDRGPPPAPFTTQQVALAGLAPGDAALMLLLRMDRLRKSPYEASVRRLLEVFYDHKTLLWSSGLDPIKDFDALLIATPNPYRLTRTFLAVRHSLRRRRVQRAINRAGRYKSGRMRWRRHELGLRGEIPSPPRLPHDPRVVILQDDLVLLTDPAHLPLLTRPDPRTDPGAPDAGVAPQSWVQQLRQMEGAGGRRDGDPGMLLQAVNLPRLVRLPPDMPVPQVMRVTVPATDPSQATALLSFATEDQAKAFLVAVPQRIQRARRSVVLRLVGVVDLLDKLKFSRKQELVRVSASLSQDQVRRVLEMMRNVIPQVRVPGMPERRPPDAGAPDAGPDAGRPDAGAPDRGGRAPDAGRPDAPRPADPPAGKLPPLKQPSWAE